MCYRCCVPLLGMNSAPVGQAVHMVCQDGAVMAEFLHKCREGFHDGGFEKRKRTECEIQIALNLYLAVDVLCTQCDVVRRLAERMPRILGSQPKSEVGIRVM